jgi:hypothetical protein
MAVRQIEIGMFQEGGGGEQDVGVIGRVILELLEDNGKQVVAGSRMSA